MIAKHEYVKTVGGLVHVGTTYEPQEFDIVVRIPQYFWEGCALQKQLREWQKGYAVLYPTPFVLWASGVECNLASFEVVLQENNPADKFSVIVKVTLHLREVEKWEGEA